MLQSTLHLNSNKSAEGFLLECIMKVNETVYFTAHGIGFPLQCGALAWVLLSLHTVINI